MTSVGAGLQPGSDSDPTPSQALTHGSRRAPNTVGHVLRLSTEHLAARGSETPRLDAELLLAKATGLERIELYMAFDRPLNAAELAVARELVGRRARREPLQYVLGEWGFRRLTLTVDSRALIPRPETEILVERALALLAGLEAPRVLDVGTGSGAIALAIADEHPGALVTGIDSSADALALAAENASRTDLAVQLAAHDLFEGLPEGPWDLVVSNPPYVDAADLATLQPEVRDWEPHAALSAEGAVEAVARGSVSVLAPGGALVLEVGEGQAAPTAALLAGLDFVGGADHPRSRRHRSGRRGPTSLSDLAEIVALIRSGELAVLPTDTVYGLVCTAFERQPAVDLYRLKGRDAIQPTAVLFASVDKALELVPELGEREAAILRALLPGPYTLILPNPAQRFAWLTGERPESIGARVPVLTGPTAEIVGRLGAVVATSANLPGEPDPRVARGRAVGDRRRGGRCARRG